MSWPRMTRRALITSTIVSALGGFLFGYDNIVISGAIGYLARSFQLSAVEVGWAAGCALLGCLLGSAGSGALADRFGLRKALYSCAFCFALSSIGVWLAGSFSAYIGWRIVGGVGIGAASIVAPMYISEIAPAAVRGRLVVFYQFGIVSGILSAVFVNLLIQRSGTDAWNVAQGWRLMFAVAALPSVLFIFFILRSQESPRWLMKVGRPGEALQVLESINGTRIASREAAAISESLQEEQGGIGELITGPFRRALAVGFILAAFSQAGGITALLSFLPEVFKTTGQRTADAFTQSVLVGVVNLLMTVLAIWLVDRAGRRRLLLFGIALQAVSLAAITVLLFTGRAGTGIVVGIMLFVGGHAIGNGAVCWVIISEIFPTKVRGAAMSIATTALWLSAYLANQFFPVMEAHLGVPLTFAWFCLMAFLNLLFVFRFVPETGGYSLEQISRVWSKNGNLKPVG